MTAQSLDNGSNEPVRADAKTLPDIVEATESKTRRFVFSCPCTRLVKRLIASWKVEMQHTDSPKMDFKKSGDWALSLIAMSTLGAAVAAYFGYL